MSDGLLKRLGHGLVYVPRKTRFGDAPPTEEALLDAFLDGTPYVVTCLEKLEAIARKFDKGKSGADFVRHYEDAARILQHRDSRPTAEFTVAALTELLDREDGKAMPTPVGDRLNPRLSVHVA